MRDWLAKWGFDTVMGAVVGAVVIALRWITKKIKASSAERDVLKAGFRALLRDRIVQAYDHYMNKGCWPIHSREAIVGMFEQYTALGGNGVIADLIDDLKELPTEKREGKHT